MVRAALRTTWGCHWDCLGAAQPGSDPGCGEQSDNAREALPSACVAARRRLHCKAQASALICSGQRATGCDIIRVKTIQSFMLRENQMVSEKQRLLGRLLVRKTRDKDQRAVADVSMHCKDKCQSSVLMQKLAMM